MSGNERIKGKVAIAGIGESVYYKRGKAPVPEFELTLDAVIAASADAGISPKEIDGFVSFHDDRALPAHLGAALGINELRWSTLQWGGGGAGGSGAVQQAIAAVAAGFADRVCVYRGLSQGKGGVRYGSGASGGIAGLSYGGGHLGPYGFLTPAMKDVVKLVRYVHETGLSYSTQKAVSMAAYHHAQQNPRAVMYGRPLSSEDYDNSRWIVEPWRLYDLTQETEGACALIVTRTEVAKDLTDKPVYVLGAAQGGPSRGGEFLGGVFDRELFATVEYIPIAKRLWEQSGVGPADVDVIQSYDNFSGLVPMALLEHGFFESAEEANEKMTFENLIVGGEYPLNTSGGNIAEAYVHGLELQVEAVRQVRGESSNQVDDVNVSFVNSGPAAYPGSSIVFGSEEAASA